MRIIWQQEVESRGENKSFQAFGGEIGRKTSTWKTQTQMEG